MEAPERGPGPEPAWAGYTDEQLLGVRICDLGVRIEGTDLEGFVRQLYDELAARGLAFRPPCYLGDEWFSPEGVPAIAIPFYLAHPRLKELELSQMLEVEGGDPEWCMKLLRHECGHAMDHAYRFSSRPRWQEVFGSPSEDYQPESFRARPYSRSFVRHLDNWYAQAHPDEDFAETFAVWLSSAPEEWRSKYQGWKALEKLEYVHELMQEAAGKPPLVRSGRRISHASKLKKTLARHYAARRKLLAEDFPDFYDADLRAIFTGSDSESESAAKFMRRERKALVASIVRWTGQPKYTVNDLVRHMIDRCRDLGLRAPANQARLLLDVGAYLAALVTNHLHTGSFKRSE